MMMNKYIQDIQKKTVLPYFGWVAMGALPFIISREDYQDRLRAMWAAEAMANWTGLRTEIQYNDPPFLTDNDWGKNAKNGQKIEFVFQDPWQADDDTDIESVYLHMLSNIEEYFYPNFGPPIVSIGISRPGDIEEPIPVVRKYSNSKFQVSKAWRQHINRYIWVSNDRARELMDQYVVPPSTGMPLTNPYSLMIDAQLTTEFFGALCPGMPEQALAVSNTPIRITSSGFATHAAQFHVLLYSHAGVVDQNIPLRDQILWMVDESRQYIPDTSKTADIVDFVRADYIANPDKENWELTRDRIYERYHNKASENGFIYRGKFESSVNFATGIMALLYGGGSFGRTIQIGTLSGWDSDNPTATMGGLLGLMRGYDALVAEFPDHSFSDRFNASRTRDNLPDYLPGDPGADDTFTLMAERMMSRVEIATLDGGGRIDEDNLYIPTDDTRNKTLLNPVHQLYIKSANNYQLEKGKNPTPFLSNGNNEQEICNGWEFDFSGRDGNIESRTGFATLPSTPSGERWAAVVYDEPMVIRGIRLVEGAQSPSEEDTLAIQCRLLVNGEWVNQRIQILRIATPASPYLQLNIYCVPTLSKGIWLDMVSEDPITIAELDGILAD